MNNYPQKANIYQVFTPGTPIRNYDLFAGRQTQIDQLISAVYATGEHAIVYGERGVGKTSLVRILEKTLADANIKRRVFFINCDAQDNFTRLWKKILRELLLEEKSLNLVDEATEIDIRDQLIQMDVLEPDDIRYILKRLKDESVVVIDELDLIQDVATKMKLANLIKALSDFAIETTIVFVGIAHDVSELLQGHESIVRALRQIWMKRMSSEELGGIIDSGLKHVSMVIDDNPRLRVIHLSQGFPFYVHSLMRAAAVHAIESGNINIRIVDVEESLQPAIDDRQDLLQKYRRAVESAYKDTLFSKVLLACALTKTDESGTFRSVDVRDKLRALPVASNEPHRTYDIPSFSNHLAQFCTDKRGKILERTGSARRPQYRFTEPLMKPYVILKSVVDGLIDNVTLRRMEYIEP